MNVSLNWIKEYVDLGDLTAKEICHRLTMTGSKVETMEEFGVKVSNVITGKVVEKVAHKEDAKVFVLKLDVGNNKILTALAKIPDIEVGQIVPVALEGAKLATDKEVKKANIMGVESECMIAHILDLGISMKDFAWCLPSGLIIFPADVKIGEDVNEILGLGDYLIEFEITPNRADCLSIEGIVKETMATFGINTKKTMQRETAKMKDAQLVSSVSNITVEVETDNCLRYMMRVADGVEIKPSPYDIQLKLIKCGIRPINNVVDATNFVMLEMGQPLHAFDIKHVNGNKIIVRQAKAGEQIETLDGVNRVLDSQAMVISNATEAMAIAGIMGGELSGISDTTGKVVIEAASFNNGNIRYTSKRQSLRTDASSRYEKSIPPELTSYAMARVCELLELTAGAKVNTGVVDVYNKPSEETKLEIDYEYINKFIGVNLSKGEVDELLARLDLNVLDSKVIVPYYRPDITIREDIVEEVARLYGLDNIPSTLPNLATVFGGKTDKQKLEDKIISSLISLGVSESYNYTFVSGNSIDRLNIPDGDKLKDMIKISNPLSAEYEYMRTSMVPSMLESLERNYLKKNKEVKLFELGKIFLGKDEIEKGKLGQEKLMISIGMIGKIDFYDLKAVVKELLRNLGVPEKNVEYTRSLSEIYHLGISADIILDGKKLATFGKISPLVIKNYNLPEDTYVAEIDFDILLEKYSTTKIFSELPKYPAVERDLALTVDEKTLSGDIEKVIEASSEYVEKVKLFDVYQGEQIEKNMKSMAYEITLRSQDKTLNDQDISNAMNKIIKNLSEKVNARVRQ